VTYNVGSPDPISVDEVARLVARVAGGEKPVRIGRAPSPDSGPPERYVPDTSRAAGLGLKVEIGLQEAVLRTADWYRANL